ncbi:MAG: agmatine deiminase family protein [Thioalkalispiraceae bacterium]|jgi:agmatine/peptidylarginine deiminase
MAQPSQSVIRFPAEWEPQDAVMLAWPHAMTDWQPRLDDIQQTYLAIIKQITRFEPVVLFVPESDYLESLKPRFLDHHIENEKIIPLFAAYNDTWLRDTGPLTIKQNNTIKFIDFRFNGWGNKFEYHLDDQLCKQFSLHPSVNNKEMNKQDLILEGGAIDTDGQGVLLTTKQCLLNKNRNPALAEIDYEDIFAELLGIKKVLWLEHGMILGDDTDGHIDMLARFCSDSVIAHCVCHQENDPHYVSLEKMTTELKSLTDPDGNNYELIELPLPKPIMDDQGERLPASYCNFLIINKAVLVPVYNDEMDTVACTRLAQAFPQREIIPVDATSIIRQGGSLHCLTMQLPAGSLD